VILLADLLPSLLLTQAMSVEAGEHLVGLTVIPMTTEEKTEEMNSQLHPVGPCVLFATAKVRACVA